MPTSYVLSFVGLPGTYMLQKLLGVLVMPAGILWCAILAASLLAWRRGAVATALAGGCLWLAFAVAGNDMLGGQMIAALERDYIQNNPFQQLPFDAVLVLGGGTSLSDAGVPQVQSAGDRVLLAARLHHRGLAPILVTSGSTIPEATEARDLSAETHAIWRDLGIGDAAIIRLPDPKNTKEEIAAYATLVRERGWHRVGLVTSAWHLRRAMRQADAHGLHAIPLPADQRGSWHYDGIISLVPTGSGLNAVQIATWELLGAAVGR